MKVLCVSVFLAVLCVCPTLAQITWRNCGSAEDAAGLRRVVSFQDSGEGEFVVAVVQGNLTEVVGDGDVQITLYSNDLVVGTDTRPLCDTAVRCPLYPGPFTVRQNILIPKLLERGSVLTIQIEAHVFTYMRDPGSEIVTYSATETKPRMFCAELDLPVQRGESFN